MLTDVIEEKLKLVPAKPGVYLWKDRDGIVLYVGKAKVLRNRVRSYHQQIRNKDLKTQLMVSRAEDLDWIVTDSEKAALLLENTLIKKFRPRYNIMLRDDKNFLSIRLSMRDDFPRLYLVRKIKRDGSIYYGPFSDARSARATFSFLNKFFPLRECTDREFASRTRPCINYQIGRSSGPCCGMISKEDYAKIVKQVRLFFEGKGEELVREVEADMERASEDLRFEDAARLRDLVYALRRTLQKQQAETPDLADRDIFGLYREGASGVVLAIFVRAGKTIGQRAFPFTQQEDDDNELIAQVIQQYYADENFVPAEVITPEPLGEMEGAMAEWLADLRGAKVKLIAPQRGDKVRMVDVATENARQQFELRRHRLADTRDVLDAVAKALNLPRLPIVVECFDISNVQGRQAVGSQVCFVDGQPSKDRYRRYKIRTKDTPDDYAMMREVLTRRVSRAIEENDWPDLMLIDGGRGQLAVAKAVLDELDVHHQPIAAITKIRVQDPDNPGPEDMAYIPGRKNPVTFRRGSTTLFFLQRIRDEAHRFALEYHRKLRGKAQTFSALDDIEGVGPARRKALVKHFGSLRKIREADVEELTQAPGITRAVAEAIYDAFADQRGQSVDAATEDDADDLDDDTDTVDDTQAATPDA
ncbi:MAG: excinuclease ABC subunit UvrC [Deltaproteobacteria bacterium]|nr:excinuclease ABC subunit UvrC [Deltaproteobacteria bacterium]MCB9488043.1 excinuclease ABC subunit UvrC [Deltaproteobacteria bacterium]